MSNFPTIVLGLLSLFLVYRYTPKSWQLYLLGFLIFTTGVGSTLWHGLRESWALTFDVVPGILFLLFFIYCWGSKVFNKYWGFGLLAGVFLIQYSAFEFISFSGLVSPFIIMYATVSTLGSILIAQTYRRYGKIGHTAVLALLLALFAASMRTLDGTICETVPFGSHLLWHITLGLAAFVGVWMLIKIEQTTSQTEHQSL